MEYNLSPGLNKTNLHTVEESHTAIHLGSGTVRVLATPFVIAFMEIAARQMLDEHLPTGYSSVGTAVNIRHKAPAPVGAMVAASAEIDSIDGNKVYLTVKVMDGETLVGEGRHERFIIEVARFLRRVE